MYAQPTRAPACSPCATLERLATLLAQPSYPASPRKSGFIDHHDATVGPVHARCHTHTVCSCQLQHLLLTLVTPNSRFHCCAAAGLRTQSTRGARRRACRLTGGLGRWTTPARATLSSSSGPGPRTPTTARPRPRPRGEQGAGGSAWAPGFFGWTFRSYTPIEVSRRRTIAHPVHCRSPARSLSPPRINGSAY